MNRNNEKLEKLDPSRRAFLSRAALAGAMGAVAVAGARPLWAQDATPGTMAPDAAVPGTMAPSSTTVETGMPSEKAQMEVPETSESDLEILSFALGLERLEAAFYSQILGAQQNRAYLPGRLLDSARELSGIENTHVETLQNAIVAARGTLPAEANYRFPANVFISPVAFSWFGYTLEEIGIGAYLGAVGKIESNSLRKAAASIYGSEVRHAALLRSLGGFTFSPRYFESPLSVAQVEKLIAPYLA